MTCADFSGIRETQFSYERQIDVHNVVIKDKQDSVGS